MSPLNGQLTQTTERSLQKTSRSSFLIKAYIGLFGLMVLFRLVLLFRTQLIPGMNGGYYPVQVRSILTQGNLGFPDMPLYFYLLSGLAYLGDLLFQVPISSTIKFVDAIALPLTLIPLYFIFKELGRAWINWQHEMLIAAFVVGTFPAFTFLGDLQKNGFALPFAFVLIYFSIKWLHTKHKKWLFLAANTLMVIGLTHFGVFMVCLLFIVTGAIIAYQKQALLSLLVLIPVSISLVAFFDVNRAIRIFSLIQETFMGNRFGIGPPEVLLSIWIYGIIVLFFSFLKNKVKALNNSSRLLLYTSLAVSGLLAFPLIPRDFGMRLMFMLIIPQSIVLHFLFCLLNEKWRFRLSTTIIIFCLVSIIGTFATKKPTISKADFENLSQVFHQINNPEESIIIAHHGIEWWVNWKLGIKVGNEQALDPSLYETYKNVYYLSYLKQNHPHDRPGPHGPAPNQRSPFGSEMTGNRQEMWRSESFVLYRWIPLH